MKARRARLVEATRGNRRKKRNHHHRRRRLNRHRNEKIETEAAEVAAEIPK